MSGIHFALLFLMLLQNLEQSPAAQPQTNGEKQRPATVSGRVILNGEPLNGVTVQFVPRISLRQGLEHLQAVADEQGRYQVMGIPAGSYCAEVQPKEFLTFGGSPCPMGGQLVNVVEGEKVEQFDLALKRGGVITGRVTDASGRPLAGQDIKLTRIDDDGKLLGASYNLGRMETTDNQGVYRIALIREGSYLVSAGTLERNVLYPQTYHTGVSDPSRARVVKVSEGAEIAGVDILIAETLKTYEIKGRVVNAETGNLVEGIEIHCRGQRDRGGAVEPTSQSAQSNAEGEFQCKSLLPGKYAIYSQPNGASAYFSEPGFCEITDGGVEGVEVKLQRAGSISGAVIIDGANDPAPPTKDLHISVQQILIKNSNEVRSTSVSAKVNADGSFRLAGLRPGKIRLRLVSRDVFWLRRVELDGNIITDGLEIGPGENLSNMRLIVSPGSLTLRGELKVTGGDLPPHVRIYVTIYRVEGSGSEPRQSAADPRGQFIFSNLIPGEYNASMGVSYYSPGKPLDDATTRLILNTRQKISIGGAGSESGEATVTFVIDLSKKEGN